MWQLIFEITEPYQSMDARALQKLKLSKPNVFNSSYQFHKSVCEEGLRPVIPFSTAEECQTWCETFLPRNEVLNYHSDIIFEMNLLIRQSWSHDPKERPNINEILQKIEEWNERIVDN